MVQRIELAIFTDTNPLKRMTGLFEEVAKLSPEIINRFLSAFEAISQPFSLDVDVRSASGAFEHWIVLKPSDAFLELERAFRAGKFHLSVIEQGHD